MTKRYKKAASRHLPPVDCFFRKCEQVFDFKDGTVVQPYAAVEMAEHLIAFMSGNAGKDQADRAVQHRRQGKVQPSFRIREMPGRQPALLCRIGIQFYRADFVTFPVVEKGGFRCVRFISETPGQLGCRNTKPYLV